MHMPVFVPMSVAGRVIVCVVVCVVASMGVVNVVRVGSPIAHRTEPHHWIRLQQLDNNAGHAVAKGSRLTPRASTAEPASITAPSAV
jgi:hypothetical protein